MGESHFPNHTQTPSAMRRTTDWGHTLPQENQRSARVVPACCSASRGMYPHAPLQGVSFLSTPPLGLTITHNFRALRERPKVQGVDNKKGAADNQL